MFRVACVCSLVGSLIHADYGHRHAREPDQCNRRDGRRHFCGCANQVLSPTKTSRSDARAREIVPKPGFYQCPSSRTVVARWSERAKKYVKCSDLTAKMLFIWF